MTYEEYKKELDERMDKYKDELKEEEKKYIVENCADIDLKSSLTYMKKNFDKLPSVIILND